jgi:hypothetical protein
MLEDEEEMQIMGGQDRETMVIKSIKSIEDVWKEVDVKTEPIDADITQTDMTEQLATQVLEPAPYVMGPVTFHALRTDLLKWHVQL